MPNKKECIKNFAVLVIFMGQMLSGFSQNQFYDIDVNNSDISFKISHMAFLTVDGNFSGFAGKISLKDSTLISVNCKIKVQSINTKDKTRDESLLDKVYLDAENHPFISFKSKKIDTDLATPQLIGILKIKDVEKEVSMPFKLHHAEAGKKIYLELETTLNRLDFGLDFGQMDSLVGDDIKVAIEILGERVP
ncbi:MAG: YceI family protein [Maribacter sp.]|nr:YceI family protein [Maribacter sp.]